MSKIKVNRWSKMMRVITGKAGGRDLGSCNTKEVHVVRFAFEY